MGEGRRPLLIQVMALYVIKRGNRWVKYLLIPFILAAGVLMYYDRLNVAVMVFSIAPMILAFEPRSWTVRKDGSVTYQEQKPLIVFRPAPLSLLSIRGGYLNLKFQTGRLLSLPTTGLRKYERNALYSHIEESLLP